MTDPKDKDGDAKSTAEPAAFTRFKALLHALINVPKKEIEVEEVRWREARRLKKKNAS